MTWGKNARTLIRFHSANKINNYNREGGKRGEKEKKVSKKIYTTGQNIRGLNVFLESLLSESLPSLGVTAHLTSLGCPPTLCWSLDLLWGQLRVYSGPTPVCPCLQCPQLSELVHFPLWALSLSSHTFHRHRVCLVDPVDLIATCTAGGKVLGLLP